MAGAPPRPPAFRAESYALPAAGLSLSAVTAAEAQALGAALAAIDPWQHYGITAANLAGLFAPAADGGIRLAVRRSTGAAPIGVVVIRSPWLVGPYMQFLAVLPGAQGKGIGRAVLDWFAAEAGSAGARNAWICAAAFNHGAQRLYRRCGYEPAAVLDGLIATGIDEVLMRKRLDAATAVPSPSGS